MEEEQMLIGNTFGGGEQTINIKDDKSKIADSVDSHNIQVVASAQRSDGLLSFQGGRVLNNKVDNTSLGSYPTSFGGNDQFQNNKTSFAE